MTNDGDGSLVIARYRGVTGASPFEQVTTDVGPLVMPRFDSVIRPTLRDRGVWEPEEADFLRRHVTPGGHVINVGANVGYTSLVIASIVGPTGQVYALEPDPLNFRLLCLNTRDSDTILPIHTAAGPSTGTIVLNRSSTNAGDHRTAPHEDGVSGVTVPVVRIDDLFEGAHIRAIVSDTQGFDHRVIAGARRMIERTRPIITVEYWPFGIRNLGDDPFEVLDGYRNLGYRRMVIVPTGEDVSACSNDEILEKATAELDHTTIALLP